ncbi:MAG: cyanophycin synthetase [Limnohabitans sp.]
MSQRDIKILHTRELRGPNIWTYRPVLEALVDIGDLEDSPSNTLPGFNERLCAWLPGLIEHRCSVGERGGFLQRLTDGTWPAHILEHVTLELQTRAGMQTGFGKAREAGPRGLYKVVVRTRQAEVSRAAMAHARDLLMAAILDQPFDVAACVRQLTDMVDRLCIGPSTASIVDAAADRGIAHIRLNSGNLVQLGQGQAQRRIWTAETDQTSAIAEGISRDKDMTKQLLAMCGVPVPEGQVVDSPAAAWEAAQDIGLPVCIKPTDGNHARGVSLDLRERADIEAAWQLADQEGSEVLVERFIPGDEHRLLVVGDQLVAANKGEHALVVGDGQHTVAELIELQINADPRRGEEEDFPLDTIRLQDHPTSVLELQRQGLNADSVPAAGREVLVMRTSNMIHDVTDQVHPEVAARVALAARIVGLDIAGVDVVTPDIRRPLEETGGAVVEVNAGPGLLMHLKPATGQPRPVGQAIVNHLFAPRENGRIPIVGLMGAGDTTACAHLLAWLLQLQGLRTGLSAADGLYLDQRCLQANAGMGFDAGQRLLINRSVQAAVFESDVRHLLSEGLPYDRCQVGIVTRMPTAAGLDDLYPGGDERMPDWVRTQIDLVLPGGTALLNGADPQVMALARYSDGEVMVFAEHETEPALQQHRAGGGRAAFWRAGVLVLAHGAQETEVLQQQRPAVAKLLRSGRLSAQDMLVASAAAWALDVPADLIRAGVKSFGQTPPSPY